jgi:hypothetical protein
MRRRAQENLQRALYTGFECVRARWKKSIDRRTTIDRSEHIDNASRIVSFPVAEKVR